MEVALVLFVIAGFFIVRSVKIVPQQHAWVKERLGKYAGTLSPGLNFLVPFIDQVAYKHSLKKVPLDVKVGDEVIYSKYSGSEVKVGEEKYLIIKQSDILAIIE